MKVVIICFIQLIVEDNQLPRLRVWDMKKIGQATLNYTPVSEFPLSKVHGNKDITNSRRPIIFPSGKIIAHDNRCSSPLRGNERS